MFLLAAFNLMRVGVIAGYNARGSDGLMLKARIGFLKITIFPRKEKKPKKKKEKRPKKEKPKKEEEKKEERAKKPFDIGIIFDLIRPALKACKRFFGGLRISELTAKVTVGGADPAKIAVNYGYLCGIAASIHPYLEDSKNVGRYRIRIDMDYTAGKSKCMFFLDMSTRIWRIVFMGGAFAGSFLISMWKRKRETKRAAHNTAQKAAS